MNLVKPIVHKYERVSEVFLEHSKEDINPEKSKKYSCDFKIKELTKISYGNIY